MSPDSTTISECVLKCFLDSHEIEEFENQIVLDNDNDNDNLYWLTDTVVIR